MATLKALDVSNYQDHLTAEDIAAWRAAGIVHAIIRASLEDEGKKAIAQRQAKLILDGGLTLGAYLWAYYTDDPVLVVVDSLRLLQGFAVRFWWIDCEETKWILTPPRNAEWLSRCLAACDFRQAPVGIYTRKDYWETYLGNTDLFASRPLLYAHYDGDPSFDDFKPFGGWGPPSGKQYSDSETIGRLTLDLDILDEDRLGVSLQPGANPAPEPVVPEEPVPAKPVLHFDPEAAVERQDVPWDCAIATTVWVLRSAGIAVTEDTLRQEMVPSIVTPAVGLLAGNGTGLAAFLRDVYGLPAHSEFPISWGWLKDMAGRFPMGIGGFGWYHWCGVRGVDSDGDVRLANPAGRWMNVGDYMTPSQFSQLGAFAAVWLDVDEVDTEEQAVIDALKEQLDQANSYIGALTTDIIYKARVRLDEAMKTDPPDDTLLREARDLLKTQEAPPPES